MNPKVSENSKQFRLGLVLLNKNEAKTISSVFSGVDINLFQDVVAIDGGSSDESMSIFSNLGLEVLEQRSQGRGEAFKLAFSRAKRFQLDALVFLSTDGNEDPKDLVEFKKLLCEGSDIVIGSRMIQGGHNEEDVKIFRFRKWGNIFFALLAYLLFGLGQKRITDPINGFRAIRTEAWFRMDIVSSDFSVEYETSIKSYRLKLKVSEFPTHENARLFGKSSAKALSTSKAMFKTLINNLKT